MGELGVRRRTPDPRVAPGACRLSPCRQPAVFVDSAHGFSTYPEISRTARTARSTSSSVFTRLGANLA